MMVLPRRRRSRTTFLVSQFIRGAIGTPLNFGRGPSQNPQKLTLAALKLGVENVKNRRFGVK